MESEETTKTGKGALKLLATKKGSRFDYQAEANWILLHKDDKPQAEMFYVRYTVVTEEEKTRPVTFIFNGGPGASSVYLHLGAAGPRRVELTAQGQPWASPYKLTDNEETWLEFSDLVFIDPVGTGFSRMLDEKQVKDKKEEDEKTVECDKREKDEYWKLNRDLESVCEFIRKFLSKYYRWECPVYIAGAVLISPALEFKQLNSSDYDVLPWIDSFPAMAAAAAHHGKSGRIKEGESLEQFQLRAAEFALNELLPVLAGGDLFPESKRARVYNKAADFIGLPGKTVAAANGRISLEYFVKNLLRSDRLILGLYDASAVVSDPYPDRDKLDAPDPTLHQLERVFAAGINTRLRAEIGLDTDRDYTLLSMKVNESWKLDAKENFLDVQIGAVDDLRYGMSLNPEMKVFISHGIFDLVTPAFSTDRLTALMKLGPEQKKMLTVKHYPGGHMYYTWAESRRAFFRDLKAFYE